MEASDVISIISITFSFLISISSLLFTWIEKRHNIVHKERYEENTVVANILSEYISSTSIAKLETLLCRAAAVKANESVSAFCDTTDKFIEKMEYATFKVFSIKEMQTSDKQRLVLELNHQHQGTICMLNELKAYCSLDRLNSTQEDDVGKTITRIEQRLNESSNLHKSIVEQMQGIASEYTKRIKK